MIRFNDNQGLKKLFRLMLIGTVISLILIFGFNYLQEEKYPKPQFNEEIGGNVVNLSTYQSVLKVALDNGNRYMIVDSRNYAYDEYLLQKLVKKGDYLEKKSNSDTLRVIRKKNSFMFVIGEDLNIALKKSEKSDL